MIVVGEASGDSHAAELVDALRKNFHDVEFDFFGSTGARLRGVRVETIVRADDLAIMGLLEIGKALPMFWQVFQQLKRAAVDKKPDAVILVDFPEFNLKLAKSLKKRGLKVIYYVSPQLWAWRGYRIGQIEKYVDLLLTILPFEKDWYAKRGINHVEFVGHPLVNEILPKLTKSEFCNQFGLNENKPIVALLAGSRRKEVSKILPILIEASAKLVEEKSDLQFVIPIAPTRNRREIETIISSGGASQPDFLLVENETREAIASADVAVVASGTATLETALLNTPLLIVYKVSSLNWKILRPFIKTEHFGLINLIANERLASEFMQSDFTVDKIANEVLRLLEPKNNQEMRQRLREVCEKLGTENASDKAAEAVMRFLESKNEKGKC